ncbi:MAG: hypothetical protein WA447_15220, partial [Candidatus Binatus sp.]
MPALRCAGSPGRCDHPGLGRSRWAQPTGRHPDDPVRAQWPGRRGRRAEREAGRRRGERPPTIAAIEKYQRRQLGWADGRVDPDGPTIHKLKGSGGVAVAAQKAGPNPPPAPTAEQNKA